MQSAYLYKQPRKKETIHKRNKETNKGQLLIEINRTQKIEYFESSRK